VAPNDADRGQVGMTDSLRATGRRRPVYEQWLDGYGREMFVANDGGRWPSTVMATNDDVLGDAPTRSWFLRSRMSRAPMLEPVALLVHLVKPFVPTGGTALMYETAPSELVLLDPFAGAAPLAPAVKTTGQRAVLIEAASDY
jgi:hypothetical protein